MFFTMMAQGNFWLSVPLIERQSPHLWDGTRPGQSMRTDGWRRDERVDEQRAEGHERWHHADVRMDARDDERRDEQK